MADPKEINDIDDLFSKDDNDNGGLDDVFSSGADPFAKNDEEAPDPFAKSDEADNLLPDFDVEASSSVSESNPFNKTDESIPLSDGFGANGGVSLDKAPGVSLDKDDIKGKKNKKAKKDKAPKVKLEKGKKEKEPKAKEPKAEVKDKSSARGIYLLGLIFLLFIIAGNAAAFMAAGAACITFLAIFDVLGLFLLLIPFLMLKALRKAPLDLFDTFLALAAAFAIISCMFILAMQASNYGKAIKAASNSLPNAVETLEC